MDYEGAANAMSRTQSGAGAGDTTANQSGIGTEGEASRHYTKHLRKQTASTSLYSTQQRSTKSNESWIEQLHLRERLSVNRAEHRLLQLNTKLLEAVENGHIEDISRLLTSGANPNATCQRSGVSACHAAALAHNESLALLVAAGALTHRTDHLGRTPLHFAAWAGNPKQIAILLDFPQDLQNRVTRDMSVETENEVTKYGAIKSHVINLPCLAPAPAPAPHREWRDSVEHDCMSSNKNWPAVRAGWTALHCASAGARLACVRVLLAGGAAPAAHDHAARAPLHVAGDAHYSGRALDVHQFLEVVKLLLSAGGAQMNIGGDKVNTPLHTAVELQSVAAIRLLLHSGASAACLNSRGDSALHLCVENRLAEHLQLLANFEYSEQDPQVSTVDVTDAQGRTVLAAAVRAAWRRGALLALGARANLCVQANDGDTPIHSAAAMGDTIILQGMLTVAKCTIDLQNRSGQTALFIAIIHNHIDAVKLLLEHGASVEVQQPYYINVFHEVARWGHVDMLKFLLEYIGERAQSLVNERSKRDCYAPVVYAVANNHPLCVALLLHHHARVNILVPFTHDITKQEIWTTPLHIAAIKNNFETATIMVKLERHSINSVNSIGMLPLHEACLNGNRNIITLFIDNGADLSAEYENTKTPIGTLMDCLPNPTAYLEELFDCFITSEGEGVTKNVIVDYRVLLPNPLELKQMKVINAFLATWNTHDQRQLLRHPLIESFVYLKWRSLLPFFYTVLALYGLFGLSLNVYIVAVFFYEDKNKLNITNASMFQNNTYPRQPVPKYLQSDAWIYMIYTTVSLIVTQEIIFFKLRNKRYYLFLETWVKFGTLGLAVFLPSVVRWRQPQVALHAAQHHLPEGVRLAATAAVLLYWLEVMYLVARFPSWGHYALMLGNVTIKVIKIMLTFGALIIGFSMCFLIQFRAQPPFEGPLASFAKTLVMITSEFDYTTIINKQNARNMDASIVILRVIFITFIIFASIVLINVMVGVAVNDVNRLEKIGSQKRLQKQSELIILLENIVCHPAIGKILPRSCCLRKGVLSKIVLNPNEATCKYGSILPRHLKEALCQKAELRMKQVDNELGSMAHKNKLDEIQRAILKQDERLEQLHTELNTLKRVELVRDVTGASRPNQRTTASTATTAQLSRRPHTLNAK